MNLKIWIALLVLAATLSCSKNAVSQDDKKIEEEKPEKNIPPETIQEFWLEHRQLVSRVYYDDSVAIYYDNEMPRNISWIAPFTKKVWSYVVQTYGDLHGNAKDRRLYGIFHKNKYGGGHPFFYDNPDHGYISGIDIGSSGEDAWVNKEGWNIDIIAHEIIHHIEFVSHGKSGSPSRKWWGDSKIAEIINYDIYMNIGMPEEAARIYNNDINKTDDFPSERTAWLKNWFWPIYTNYGKTEVLQRYFKLLSDRFPQNSSGTYTRDMSFGEFIHFWSGAAKVNLKNQAVIAFGWNDNWEREWKQAQSQFPNIGYTY
ncbi:hypothetical protein [Sphingobacterium pedocola]|jgi:hypothetical protein|uniref:Uncharacterized protein n=1 Tax=Sphingobacterium pedocola TaxID=2082722 RepID=A0ABR9T205_9SPHI|nr:hypothetical protein [Sphingobacterium pedocola]MBE8719360.1 hypothetical protein [Sphingobacterium pedocola]